MMIALAAFCFAALVVAMAVSDAARRRQLNLEAEVRRRLDVDRVEINDLRRRLQVVEGIEPPRERFPSTVDMMYGTWRP